MKLIKQYAWEQRLKKAYLQDKKRFAKYSFFGKSKTKRHYQADLIFYYHKIEKGLSLSNPRVGFGEDTVRHLILILENYLEEYGWDDISICALNTLISYHSFNKKNNLNLPDLYIKLEQLRKTIPDEKHVDAGGIRELKREEIDKSTINFKDFAYSRYSIRNFAPGDVSLEIIKEAVYIAQKTPSVCNRQTSKVYVYSNEKLKEEILSYQNGNAGFGTDASKILIVTSELKDYRGITERNQPFIDGGMYSMSLIYALHSLGVGTCPLNLMITKEKENRLKKVAKISDSEVLLMMIAVGNLPSELNVAYSNRRRIEEVMQVL